MATTAVKEASARAKEAVEVTEEELIEGLNRDLAAEFQAVITYRLFASLASGPYRQTIREFFEAEIPDELAHAGYLADKIVSLGGEPGSEPLPVETTRDNREMFEIALQAESDTIVRYEERVRQAEALGHTGLKIQLEDMIADETRHKDEMQRILSGWPG